jgi:hypothetical protein
MDRKHTLVGEDFFRTMMRLEDERKRCFAGGNLWSGAGSDGSGTWSLWSGAGSDGSGTWSLWSGAGGDGSGTWSSNVVSLEQYQRERRQVVLSPADKPTKPAA